MLENEKEPNVQSEYADVLIRRHTMAAMGAGVIPVALADILTITAIQVDMVRQLCSVYQVPYSRTRVKSILASLLATTLARAGARSLIKKVPVIGWAIGGATQALFAGASTYAIGKLFKAHLAEGGTLVDFNIARAKKYYASFLRVGVAIVRTWLNRKSATSHVEPSNKAALPGNEG